MATNGLAQARSAVEAALAYITALQARPTDAGVTALISELEFALVAIRESPPTAPYKRRRQQQSATSPRYTPVSPRYSPESPPPPPPVCRL